MGEPIKRTVRGFGIYAELVDRYGAGVDVIESSLAEEACVWIFVDGGEIARDLPNKGAAHLDLQMAIEIRDALSSWIENAEKSDV